MLLVLRLFSPFHQCKARNGLRHSSACRVVVNGREGVRQFSIRRGQLGVLVNLQVVINASGRDLTIKRVGHRLLGRQASSEVGQLAKACLVRTRKVRGVPNERLATVFVAQRTIEDVRVLIVRRAIGRFLDAP